MTPQRYNGSIKLAGMPTFEFATSATSEKKAKSNGLAQFARRLNMSIPALSSYLKKNSHQIVAHKEEK